MDDQSRLWWVSFFWFFWFLETLNDNYVRPNEANKAQSKVATKGKYKFIDKVHVNYVEKDRRHWAVVRSNHRL